MHNEYLLIALIFIPFGILTIWFGLRLFKKDKPEKKMFKDHTKEMT